MATYKGHTHITKPGNVRLPNPWAATDNIDIPVSASTRVNPAEVERPKHQIYNKTVGKFLGKVNEGLDKMLGGDSTQTILAGNVNKSWRGLIILNRLGLNPLKYTDKYVFDYIDKGVNFVTKPGGLTKAISLVRSKKYSKTSSDLATSEEGNIWVPGESALQGTHRAQGRRILVGRDLNLLKNEESFKGAFTMFSENETDDFAVVADPSEGRPNSILIFNPLIEDVSGKAMFVELQNRPKELDYQPQSTWADIKSMGRNVPMYHYTGSETTLQFSTSWYMPGKPGDPDFDMFWVIKQCRTLESWSMANGYLQAPPYLYILWGESDLFSEHLWILHSATYKLMDFHDRVLVKSSEALGLQGNDMFNKSSEIFSLDAHYKALINQGLVPFSATQELIFKRVAGINLWYSDIAPQRKSLKTDYTKDAYQ